MRKLRFILMALVVLALPAWVGLGSVMSARTLVDLTARPMVALVEGDGAVSTRWPVVQAGQVADANEAHWMGANGTWLGYTVNFLLSDGEMVVCQASGQSITCDQGWQAERASP